MSKGIVLDCTALGRTCGELNAEEALTQTWEKLLGEHGDGIAPEHVVEIDEIIFSLAELYWSAQALGGSKYVKRWRDVAMDMKLRRTGNRLDKDTSQGYAWLNKLWERWSLLDLERSVGRVDIPEEYERPKDPARLKDLHTKRRTVVPLSLGGTYVRGQRFPEHAAPLKVEKLEEELPFEARLHMALVQCASAVRGRMTADIELWARLSKDLLPYEDNLLTVNEALGSDRAGRRYWILSGDYSTVFVETPPPLDAPLGAQSQWQRLRNSAHLERLRAALDSHGRAESVLLESLGLRWELLTAAMDKAQLQGAPEGEAGCAPAAATPDSQM